MLSVNDDFQNYENLYLKTFVNSLIILICTNTIKIIILIYNI